MIRGEKMRVMEREKKVEEMILEHREESRGKRRRRRR
jgi:hypothetical protein